MGDPVEKLGESGDKSSLESLEGAKTLSDFGIPIKPEPSDEVETKENEDKSTLSEMVDPAETKGAETLAKQKLTNDEKKVLNDYGGSFFKMSDLPGLEKSGMGSQMHVSVPDMTDEKYKGKKPRVVCWFHQNGGQKYDNVQSKKVYELVKKMRENGDPVVLIMPRDHDIQGGRGGNWMAMQKPDTFKKMVEHAEKLTGRRLGADISLGSSSGGYMGVAGVLKSLREQRSTNKRADELYRGIRQIGLCDSLYGREGEFAKWFTDDPKKKVLHAYGGTPSVHRHTELLRTTIVKFLQDKGESAGPNLDIPPERLSHIGHDVDREHLARYLARPSGDTGYLEKSESSGKGIPLPPVETPVQPPVAANPPDGDEPQESSALGEQTNPAADLPIATPSTADTSEGGVAGARWGGGNSAGGGYVEGYHERGANDVHSTPAAVVDQSPEDKENEKTGKVFVLGSALSEDEMKRFVGVNFEGAKQPTSMDQIGQSSKAMLDNLQNEILKNDVNGATLVIVGGKQDLFAGEPVDEIKKNLNTMYKSAKDAGMKVIVGTVPPLAESPLVQEWATRKNVGLDEYKAGLIERWETLNEWIGGEHKEDGEVEPDSVVNFSE